MSKQFLQNYKHEMDSFFNFSLTLFQVDILVISKNEIKDFKQLVKKSKIIKESIQIRTLQWLVKEYQAWSPL